MFFFQYIRELRPFVVFSALLFGLGVLLGSLVVESQPGTATLVVREAGAFLNLTKSFSQPGLFLFVLVNNAVKTLVMMYMGIVLGIVPVLFLVVNGLVVQVFAERIAQVAGGPAVFASLVPHGVVEVVAVLLGAAVGLRLGTDVFRRLSGRPVALKASLSEAWRFYSRILLPMLAIAAAVEIWITPEMVRLVGQ
jgi:stage II sporulation protein M